MKDTLIELGTLQNIVETQRSAYKAFKRYGHGNVPIALFLAEVVRQGDELLEDPVELTHTVNGDYTLMLAVDNMKLKVFIANVEKIMQRADIIVKALKSYSPN